MTEREMGEEDGGGLGIERRASLIQPGESAGGDAGVEDALTLGGIDGDELPAAGAEGVVGLAGKDFVEGGAVVVGQAIVIAHGHVKGRVQPGENVANGEQLILAAILGKIAIDNAEGGAVTAHGGHDFFQPGMATLVAAMDIVHDHKAEVFRGSREGGGEGGEPESGQPEAGAAEHLPA